MCYKSRREIIQIIVNQSGTSIEIVITSYAYAHALFTPVVFLYNYLLVSIFQPERTVGYL